MLIKGSKREKMQEDFLKISKNTEKCWGSGLFGLDLYQHIDRFVCQFYLGIIRVVCVV